MQKFAIIYALPVSVVYYDHLSLGLWRDMVENPDNGLFYTILKKSSNESTEEFQQRIRRCVKRYRGIRPC